MALLFSKVTVTAGNDAASFLVRRDSERIR